MTVSEAASRWTRSPRSPRSPHSPPVAAGPARVAGVVSVEPVVEHDGERRAAPARGRSLSSATAAVDVELLSRISLHYVATPRPSPHAPHWPPAAINPGPGFPDPERLAVLVQSSRQARPGQERASSSTTSRADTARPASAGGGRSLPATCRSAHRSSSPPPSSAAISSRSLDAITHTSSSAPVTMIRSSVRRSPSSSFETR